jgi:hypothetical protein
MRRGGSTRPAGLPISEVISEGNVGLMQGVKRFEACFPLIVDLKAIGTCMIGP